MTASANTLQLGIGEKLGSFISSLALVISALAIAFAYSWKLTLVTSCGLVLICIAYALTVPRVVGAMKRVEEADIKAAGVAGEVLGSVRMVAACGAEVRMAGRYTEWVEESMRRGLGMTGFVAVQQAVGEFFCLGR